MESTLSIIPFFWIGTIVMLFLVFVLLFMAVFYQKQFAKMRQKEAELLLKTALYSEKTERKRIAKDLHDSVQGDIAAIRNYVSLLSKQCVQSESQNLIEIIKKSLAQTAENTRLISYNLMPPLLEKSGFCVAVSDYFDQLSESTGKKFSLQAELHKITIPSSHSYELFRIIQEFTQNMLKYGSISECKLFIYETENNINLELVDDGIHFNFKTNYSESKGSGLYNIISRLTSIGAELIQREVFIGNHFIIILNNTP